MSGLRSGNILTEESEDDRSRLDIDFFWCIDPLDGTLYYSESEPGYSISIALVSKSGKSMLGVIYDPYEEKLYTAIKGQNSFINQIPINRMSTEDKDAVTILCDRHFLQHKVYNEFIDELSYLLAKEGCHLTKILSNGDAVKNFMGVLDHSPACYFKLPKEQFRRRLLMGLCCQQFFFMREMLLSQI